MTYAAHPFTVPSPIGDLLLVSNGEALTGVYLDTQGVDPRQLASTGPNAELFASASEQLQAYFRGELTEFDLPLAVRGTPFQERVWKELRSIPFGCTISYAELARRLRQPTATRAVGAANGRNPVAIIIPCHRVIGKDGSLTGYGGGLDRKRWLLGHESAVARARSGLGSLRSGGSEWSGSFPGRVPMEPSSRPNL